MSKKLQHLKSRFQMIENLHLRDSYRKNIANTIKNIEQLQNSKKEEVIKCVLISEPGKGKSTFINHATGLYLEKNEITSMELPPEHIKKFYSKDKTTKEITFNESNYNRNYMLLYKDLPLNTNKHHK